MSTDNKLNSKNQLQLLKEKRFGPFFLTQFFGAFNDNVFKNALIILVAFQSSYSGSEASNNIINLAAILFILPFFLFSATAGQIADRFEKAALIRKIKLGEIGIMLFAAIGFYLNNIPFLLLVLFLMGSQSSFFGPIKYSIIPEHLKKEELIGGNALVESGTFMAILLGTIFGGFLVGISSDSRILVSCTVIALASLGYISSLNIPLSSAVDPMIKIRWNPFTETFRNIKLLRENRTVFFSILGIAWFWFLGATYITQLPNFTHLALGADAQVVTLFLALFCIGIGLGSLLCEKLSNHTIELGLVPIGSMGLSLFGVDVFFAATLHTSSELLSLQEFIQIKSNWRLCIDMLFIGAFGGIYIVPLYALIQARTNPQRRARVIAGNNILNAVAIAAASIYAMVLLNADLNIPQLFLIAAILNAVFALYLFVQVPEFITRFVAWVLTHLAYRVKKNTP
ncbi:MAG: MFS transporter [Gammaproteobacteria bacterium]|nr:MFS transporter [Gammaproteobacteria bacterium]